MGENQPARQTCKVTCYAGYIQLDGKRIDVSFEAATDASKEQLDAAFLSALAQHATFDYLAIGDCEKARDDGDSSPGFRVGEVQRGIRHVDTIHELYIKIAADTIALLRKVDVFRVIDSVRPDNIDGVSRSSLANWIKAKRPDLGTEVDEVMAELA